MSDNERLLYLKRAIIIIYKKQFTIAKNYKTERYNIWHIK